MGMALPAVGDSVLTAGNPRSGKTVLSKALFRAWMTQFTNGIVLQVDSDEVKPWDKYCEILMRPDQEAEVYLNALRKAKTICVDGTKLNFKKLTQLWNRLCAVGMARGNTLLVCDEISRVSDANSIGDQHFLLITGRGRKRKCSVIQATQRMQNCSIDIRSYARHKFIFRLDDRDVEYLDANSVIPNARQILSLRPYHCIHAYYGESGRTVTEILPPCKL